MNLLRQVVGSAFAKVGVRDLGTPAKPLFDPQMATEKATFAMACFWAPDAQFGCAKGVVRTRVGYSGGDKENPTYRNLVDHTETVDIDYDPSATTYEELLRLFWKNHDPTARCPTQYKSVIFFHDDEQRRLAEESFGKEEKARGAGKIKTQILPAKTFYNAEGYHQKYLLQQHPSLLKAIGIKPASEELIKSHVAARLNGYAGGYGKMAAFEQEWEKLGLNAEMADYVRDLIRQGPGGHC